jgi:hypothetical protein
MPDSSLQDELEYELDEAPEHLADGVGILSGDADHALAEKRAWMDEHERRHAE